MDNKKEILNEIEKVVYITQPSPVVLISTVNKNNGPMVSKIINTTLQKDYIKEFDPNSSAKKFKKYIPYWA